MLAFLQNEFWFLRLPLHFFPKQCHLCFWFQFLTWSLVDSQTSYPSLLTFLLCYLEGTLNSAHIKYSLSSSSLQVLLFYQCSFLQGLESLFFYLSKPEIYEFLFHIQLITKSCKSIDFTFSLRASMPTFLPGVLFFLLAQGFLFGPWTPFHHLLKLWLMFLKT